LSSAAERRSPTDPPLFQCRLVFADDAISDSLAVLVFDGDEGAENPLTSWVWMTRAASPLGEKRNAPIDLEGVFAVDVAGVLGSIARPPPPTLLENLGAPRVFRWSSSSESRLAPSGVM
jgi:hypothetical protein